MYIAFHFYEVQTQAKLNTKLKDNLLKLLKLNLPFIFYIYLCIKTYKETYYIINKLILKCLSKYKEYEY